MTERDEQKDLSALHQFAKPAGNPPGDAGRLLPCPFCGLAPDRNTASSRPDYEGYSCDNPFCEVNPETSLWPAGKAKKLWNTRALAAEKQAEQLRGDAQKLHRVMALLTDMRMGHGRCLPRKDRACTHCNAVDDLESEINRYTGPPVVLASSAALADREKG